MRWTPRHTFGVTASALLGHSLLWGATQPTSNTARLAVAALLVLTALLLGILARRVPTTSPAAPPPTRP